MTETNYTESRKGPWYCDWNWCRIKFTNSKELGKHVMEHIDEDHATGLISCRLSEAKRLRRVEEGLDSVSYKDSLSQSVSQSFAQVVVLKPTPQTSITLQSVSPPRARSRSHDDEGERPRKRMRSFADVDAGSSPDAEVAPLPDSPDIFNQAQEPNLKNLPPSPSPATANLTISPGTPKTSKRPWRLPASVSNPQALTAQDWPTTSQIALSQEQPTQSHGPVIAPAGPAIQSNGGNEYGEWVDGIMSQAPFYNF
ncbi:hypothetical protein PENSPDRAFT_752930 [Peniophora sp. CONT]|nr:hypothetical protein PENSPDRAFT_752930 [Peniophora sp. CONT]